MKTQSQPSRLAHNAASEHEKKPDSDKSSLLPTPQIAVPRKKRTVKQSTPISHRNTSAFRTVAPQSTVIDGIQSIAEQNPPQESQFEVSAIKPQIVPAVQTYTSPKLSARTFTALEAEIRSNSGGF